MMDIILSFYTGMYNFLRGRDAWKHYRENIETFCFGGVFSNYCNQVIQEHRPCDSAISRPNCYAHFGRLMVVMFCIHRCNTQNKVARQPG
jgi:hypothetical protein